MGRIIFPLLITLSAFTLVGRAQSHWIEGGAPDLIESGAPQFEVRTYQTLGLDAPPTDLHVLPDGRILLFAGQQIAIGDGVRWERFQQAADDPLTAALTVGVDRDGTIYMGVAGGFARVEFAADARWRLRLVAPWTSEHPAHAPVLRSAIQVGDDWFWHGDSGPLVGWRPGKDAQVFGRPDTTEQVMRLRDDFYLSDRTTGQLWRLAKPAMEPVNYTPNYSVRDTISCGVPFGPDQLLVGTFGRGLKLFDGRQIRAFPSTGHLGEGTHINALCEISGGLYAAAVESYGLVFFDRQGRTIQVLDHRVAHQLNHVRLLRVTGGAIVGLLGEGIVRVEVPSRVSHFEPIAATRLTTSDPYRVDGRLWLNADGNMMRATYDQFGLLNGFAVDTPPGSFMYTFSNAMGIPIATTENGFFTRTNGQWTLVSADVKNMRVIEDISHQGRWLYAAPHELGWLRPTDHGIEIERFKAPAIDHPYHSETAEDGSVWVEQGNARVVRVSVVDGRPTAEAFGRESGLPDGWVQLFTLDGRIGFSTSGQILRFVESTRRFERDEQFARDFPGLTNISGRPARDSLGRVWIAANGSVQVLAGERGHWRNLDEPMPPGFQPYFFFCEKNGVVWMHSDRRLARFDPSLPPAPSVPFRAIITHLSFSGSGRTVFSLTEGLPPIASDDNSFAVHFLAPNCPFGSSIDFEVRLDGVDSRWSSTGSGGAAIFNHLKPGRYLLHVRPRAGGRTGDEATLAFTVLPPWYLTQWAYFGYVLGALGLTVLIVRVVSILERREKARLEHLVEERTQELNEGIERRRRLEAQLLQAQKLESLGTLAGGIAHDFNNLLTSILGFCDLAGLSARKDDPVQADLRQIRTAGLRARDLVAQILTFSRQRQVALVPLDLAQHVAEALKLIRASTPSTIEIVTHLESGKILADPTQIHQIVINLCSNAVHAMHGRLGRLEVTLKCREIPASVAAEVPNLVPGTAMHLIVADTGSGMDAATLERIFDPFFTTKPAGEGTGLGLSIVQGIVHSHHGALRVRSTPGSGTIFDLFFSVTDANAGTTLPVDTVPRGNNEEILVVDDEQSVAAFVSKKLLLLGYRTTVFSDPRAALAEATAAPGRFHAMVSDLTMPGLTGIELVERCRAAGADFPVVIITGYRTDTVQSSLHNMSRCTVLPKPFEGNDLSRALHRVIHENRSA